MASAPVVPLQLPGRSFVDMDDREPEPQTKPDSLRSRTSLRLVGREDSPRLMKLTVTGEWQVNATETAGTTYTLSLPEKASRVDVLHAIDEVQRRVYTVATKPPREFDRK